LKKSVSSAKGEKMLPKQLASIGCATALIFSLALIADQASAQEKAAAMAAPRSKPTIARICINCHEAQEGNLRGNFDNVSFKSRSIQLKIDNSIEILKFDEKTIKVVTADKIEDVETLGDIMKGHEVRIEYSEKNGVKTATLVSIKAPVKLTADMIIATEEVEKLVAKGTEKGKYTLVDSRTVPGAQEGAIPTAINIPFPSFDTMTDKLPKDKNELLIFYCGGITCYMSPASAEKSKKLGYTNTKVYRDGMSAWQMRNYGLLSAQFLKEAWIDKDIPHILIDVRSKPDAEKGSIKGAVWLPSRDIIAHIPEFPPPYREPPIMIYDRTGGVDAKAAAKTLITAGYNKVDVVRGGFDAWKAAKYPVESGRPATHISYVPKPRPGEIPVNEFKKIAAAIPANVLILDVRNQDEANFGMIKGAKLLPDEEILDRLAEIPKDRQIITYCSTGVRAEMTYHKLKEKGYHVKFLNANVDFDGKGNYTVEKP
jgi:rhodanese-related sulfurtransferase